MADAEATPTTTVVDEKAGLTESVETPAQAVQASTESESADPEKVVSVFDDASHFTVKHPLRHKWTLWYTKPASAGRSANWSDQLKEIISFDSVEEFWGVYNNIPKASELPLRSDYHLFRTGVRPEWEDEQNSKGGKWAYQCQDKQSVDIDKLWLNTLLGTVGETIDGNGKDQVMGIVATIRKAHYRISVWIGSFTDETVVRNIGLQFKKCLELSDKEYVDFASHTDAASSGSSRARSRLQV
ncbi:translation initiation factor eIF 4e-like domain-containing protein [Lipomyces oligophaga]|uniref:translation initiation factor eIF 4e-like domain-containing protein n=1 Tax=Lipomyces oligophaga TaxID=45792 RepID=UPI0034CD428D